MRYWAVPTTYLPGLIREAQLRFRLIRRETKFFYLTRSRLGNAPAARNSARAASGRSTNQTFIIAFDREDIYRLISSLDDVLNFVNAMGVPPCHVQDYSARRRQRPLSRTGIRRVDELLVTEKLNAARARTLE